MYILSALLIISTALCAPPGLFTEPTTGTDVWTPPNSNCGDPPPGSIIIKTTFETARIILNGYYHNPGRLCVDGYTQDHQPLTDVDADNFHFANPVFRDVVNTEYDYDGYMKFYFKSRYDEPDRLNLLITGKFAGRQVARYTFQFASSGLSIAGTNITDIILD